MSSQAGYYWSDGAAGPVLKHSGGAAGAVLRREEPQAQPASSWEDLAECRDKDPDAWFPPVGVNPVHAKTVCMRCPVRDECLQFALDNRLDFGVWGGLSENERRQIPRQTTPQPARTAKTCPACRKLKPLSEFHAHRRAASGHSSRCAECINGNLRAKRAGQTRQRAA